jgi:YD repeat-containing protein
MKAMKKMKKITAVAAMFLLALCGRAQQTANQGQRLEELRTVIPASPNAAGLGKYGDWPVNLYTGTVGVNLPLYTVAMRGLGLPIGLGYHASGIRVSDVAGWTGLGWSLNAGGAIVRSVKGMPDELNGAGYHAFRQQFLNPNDLASGTGNVATNNQLKIDAADAKWDTEPDNYTLNAMGRSYKLIIKGNGSIITVPYSQIKVTADFLTDTWNVTLEDGTQLLFGQNCTEKVGANRNWHVDVPRDPFATAWYLKKITTVAGETANFSYHGYTLHQNNTFFQSDYFKNSAPYGEVSCAIGAPCVISGNLSPKNGGFVQHGEGLNLAAIETDAQRVEFVAATAERLDMQGGNALAAIKVFDKLTGGYTKTFTFNYTYSTAVNDYGAGSNSYHKKRLKLMQVDEAGEDGMNAKSWKFGYNAQALPSVKSYAQDHWGYFNGATNNKTLLPQIFSNKYVVRRGFDPDVTPVGDREPKANFVGAEMLERVTYPTGGHTQFTFEPNSYPANEEQFQQQQIDQALYLDPATNPFVNVRSNSFTTTKEQYVKYNFTGTFSQAYLGGIGANTIMARCKLLDGSGNALSTLLIRKPDVGQDGTASKSAYAYLPPGNYTLETSSIVTEGELSGSETVQLASGLTYEGSIGMMAIDKMCGGVRIRAQEDFDAVTNVTVKKSYLYSQPFVIEPFSYDQFYLSDLEQELDRYYTYGVIDPCSSGEAHPSSNCYQKYLVRGSAPKYALGSVHGSTVGYGRVTTVYGANGQGGRTVSEFENVADGNLYSALEFPFPQSDSRDWQRGQLLRETVYDTAGMVVAKTENVYELLPPGQLGLSVSSYKVGWARIKFRAPEISILVGDLLTNLNVKDVVVSSGLVRPSLTTKTAYRNGAAASTKVTRYYYDNPANIAATRTETVNSKGEVLKTINRTPLEKTGIQAATPLTATASAAVDSMLARNMIAPVLQTESYRNGQLLARSLTDHKVWANGLVLPELVKLQKGNGALEERLRLNAYDSWGNLLEQQQPGGPPQCYLWGYNKIYPVAQVLGANHATVAALVNQAVLDSPLSTEQQIRAETDKVRTALAGTAAQVTTYTYRPLVGITSQTDNNGQTLYYRYDAMGRLKAVVDKDGNVVGKHVYQLAD